MALRLLAWLLATLATSPDRIAAWLVLGELMCKGAPPKNPVRIAVRTAATNAAEMPAETKAGPIF